eukprot:COSAG02_NODE_5011_length_4725_cov_2.510160_3_plen_733_part_00
MALVNLTTNLKSLRYGKDTVGGGNSNQPYVTTKIPESFSKVGKTGGPDFLLRGGTLLPKIVANDVSRLTQMFFDFKSPNGPLFVAKQNVLSLTNVNSSKGYIPYKQEESSTVSNVLGAIGSFIQDNLAMNQGAYTPLGTIAQVAGNAVGLHTNKQGLNPLAGIGGPGAKGIIGAISNLDPLGLPTYLSTISTGGDEGNKSRLFGLLDKIDKNTQGINNLYSYSGGPGATLGVGKTNIVMVGDQRTGINNAFNSQLQFNSRFNLGNFSSFTQQVSTPLPPLFQNPNKPEVELFSNRTVNSKTINYIPSIYNPGLEKNKNITNKAGVSDIKFGYGATIKYVSLLDPERQSTYLGMDTLFNNGGVISPISFTRNVYKPGTLTTNEDKLKSGIKNSTSRQVWTQEEIEAKDSFSQTNKADNITDFRKKIKNSDNQIPNTLPYTNNNKFEQRVNLGNPGKKGNISSYSIGKRDPDQSNVNKLGNSTYTHALDKVNAYPLYRSSEVTQDKTKNDFVKFRIGVISNENPANSTFIHFRAIIDGMSDSYSSDWESQKFMGRGENFYKYQGFDRKISLSWTVAAQSKQELIPMYQKLNYLASATAPSYSEAGYMGGNLISLTIGGWCYEQVGIMSGLTLDVPTESPWEIAIPDGPDGGVVGEGDNEIKSDKSVKEMPMIIKVSGFTFTPIHNFVPQVQKNGYNGAGGFISNYGKERFIALNNGFNNNYSGFNYIPPKVNKT